jgi:hypothetical protein
MAKNEDLRQQIIDDLAYIWSKVDVNKGSLARNKRKNGNKEV